MSRCKSCFIDLAGEDICGKCKRELFSTTGKVSLILNFSKKDFFSYRKESAPRLSISGVQDKLSLRLKKGTLVPTEELGGYILKPVPGTETLECREDIPANEHVTMHMARIFNITTAPSAVVSFSDGEPAYITRRFDRKGINKLLQEDFCQLSNRTEESHGRNYKYDGTYEEMGDLLKQYCPAYRVEIVKLFRQLVYCYVAGNGDAHLKNFSLIESGQGDHLLSPAYDLLNTTVHIPSDSRTALDMFRNYESEYFLRNGFYSGFDFMKLAEMFGIHEKIASRIITSYLERTEIPLAVIDSSFMSLEAKSRYRKVYQDRILALGIGFKQL